MNRQLIIILAYIGAIISGGFTLHLINNGFKVSVDDKQSELVESIENGFNNSEFTTQTINGNPHWYNDNLEIYTLIAGMDEVFIYLEIDGVDIELTDDEEDDLKEIVDKYTDENNFIIQKRLRESFINKDKE